MLQQLLLLPDLVFASVLIFQNFNSIG